MNAFFFLSWLSLIKLYRSIDRGCSSQAIWYDLVAYPVRSQSFLTDLYIAIILLDELEKAHKAHFLSYSALLSVLNVDSTGCRFNLTSDSRRRCHHG